MKKIISFFTVIIIILSLSACGADNPKNPAPNGNTDQTQKSTEYDTGIVLSENLMDFTIKIDGAIYKIPMELSAFQKNGWALPSGFDTEKEIASDHFESATIEKGSSKLNVELINKSLDVQKASSCPIGRITYDFSGDIDIYLAGNTLLNSLSQSEMIEKFGQPTSSEEYGEYVEMVYEKPNTSSIYERYTFQFDIASGKLLQMNVVNFVETIAQDSGNGDTGYLDKYSEPTELGTDMLSFNVSVLNDLYALPAPVSQLLNNGWSIVSNDVIGAGTYKDNVLFEKDGKKYALGVYNFSKQQAEIKDCTIYKVEEDPFDNAGIGLKLPGNIAIGSSEADVERMCSGFNKSDAAETVEYVKTTYEYMIKITVSKETNAVNWITVYNKNCNYR